VRWCRRSDTAILEFRDQIVGTAAIVAAVVNAVSAFAGTMLTRIRVVAVEHVLHGGAQISEFLRVGAHQTV
jgi:malic enzyme